MNAYNDNNPTEIKTEIKSGGKNFRKIHLFYDEKTERFICESHKRNYK